MVTDLEMAYNALMAKKPIYDKYFNYFDGNQPLIYSTEKLKEIFGNIDARFTQNWCSIVVDAVLERLSLMSFVVNENEAATDVINDLYQSTEMNLDSDAVHLAALVCGEAFVVAWREDGEEPQAFYHDPRNCHVFYMPDNPRKKRFGCKWWMDDADYCHMTLYYPDRLEYYITKSPVINGAVVNAKAFEPAEVPNATNTFGEVPVFHFRRERRGIKSELLNIIEMQDAINKLLSDMMVAAEFGAFPQRYIISQMEIKKGQLANTPGNIWRLNAGDNEGQGTAVGQLAAAELGNYLQAIEQTVSSVAVISRTPKHYFLTQGGDPSGEALIAMEAPLNKKAQKYIDRFSATWREVATFLLKLAGTAIQPTDITATFDRPETVQPKTQAEIRKVNVESGIPLTTQLRDEGWTQQEIDDMQEDKKQEQESNRAGLGAALLNAQAGFDQGNQTDEETQ